jgi:hypothetical protein
MEVESGLLFINDTDMATYGCFLWEDNQGGHANYDALMAPPEMKEYTTVEFREMDGEELPAELIPKYKARDIILKLAIVAETKAQWFEYYNSVLALLRSGWLEIRVPEIGKAYKVYLKKFPKYSQFTLLRDTGQQVAGFSVTFREPKPVF